MRCLAFLIALCAAPAFGGEWRTATPSKPFVTAKACPCGLPGCACPPGECDCPKGATANVSGSPAEWLAFSAAWCLKCRGREYPVGVKILDFDKEQALAKACGVESIPAYVVREGGKVTKKHEGAMTFAQAEAFYALAEEASCRPSDDGPDAAGLSGRPAPPAKRTGAVAARPNGTLPRAAVSPPSDGPAASVRRSVPPARTSWTYSGRDLAAHLRSAHGIDPSGMSYQDMVNAHSHAHEGTWRPARRSPSRFVASRGCVGCGR